MKFIVWAYDIKESENNETRNPANVGDTAMVLAQRKILKEAGILDKDIIELTTNELFEYKGEIAICPICFCTDGMRFRDIADFPTNIIPVFISLSINSKELTPKQISFYKQHEPIGCRDEQTLYLLKDNGINAYLFGCMAVTLFEKIQTLGNKILFVDVPKCVLPYVPEYIKRDIEFVKQEQKIEDLPKGLNSREFGLYIIEKYKKDARMVVTSRFHGGVLALGYGIPVIIINENYTFRFSFLKKLLPFYTRKTLSQIDWNPQSINFESEKKRMLEIAVNRLKYTIDLYENCLIHEKQLKMDCYQEGELIDYYDSAIEYINNNWNTNTKINYAIWGVNNNAQFISDYIDKNFPNAKLVEIYDSFKTINFKGLTSISPGHIKKENDYFIFVTTFVAGYNALKIFNQKKIPTEKFFICNREYIEAEDIIDK